jgi:hypothetical protein
MMQTPGTESYKYLEFNLDISAMRTTSVSSMHASGTCSLETWTSCQGSAQLHQSTRDLVSNAWTASNDTALLSGNVASFVARFVVVSDTRSTVATEETSSGATSSSGCDRSAASGASVVAAEHFDSLCLFESICGDV